MLRLLKHILENKVLFYGVIVRTYWMTLVNTRIFPTTGYARVLLFMFIRRELGGMVQDVYFSLHTVSITGVLNRQYKKGYYSKKTKLFTRYQRNKINIILRQNLNLVRVLLFLCACKFSG